MLILRIYDAVDSSTNFSVDMLCLSSLCTVQITLG